MRPKSGRSIKSKSSFPTPRGTKQSLDHNHFYSIISKASNSRISSNITPLKNTWQLKRQQLNICTNVKNIGLIHAYQPQQLKKCLANNPKSYKKFYNSYGGCSLTLLLTKSFLAHFRQWRQSLRSRLINLIQLICQNKYLIKQSQIRQIFLQLQTIAQQMKQATQQVLNAPGPTQSIGKTRNLHQNFELMAQYIRSLFMIIKHLFQYSRNIQQIMQQGAQKQGQVLDLQKKIKKLHKQYQHIITQYLHKCLAHPQSSYMNKAQHKLKIKFDMIQKQSILSLSQIIKLRQLIDIIDQNLDILDKNKKLPEQYTTEHLQNIINTVNQYQQIKLIKNYGKAQSFQQQCTNRVILAQLEHFNLAFSEFVAKFKQISLHILRYEYYSLSNLKVVHILPEGTDRYKISKKKLLLLTKIYTRNNNLQYYEQISQCIKNTSQNYEQISKTIDLLVQKAKNRRYLHNNYIIKNIQDVIVLVIKYEQNKDSISKNIIKICNDNDIQIKQQQITKQKQSDKLKKFLSIMKYSQHRVQQLVKIPKYPKIDNKKQIKKQQIQKIITKNNKMLSNLINYDFKQGKLNIIQLKKLLNDKLLQKFIGNNNQLHKQSIYCIQIFYQFYNKIYNGDINKKKINKQMLIKILQFYQININNLTQYKNYQQANKFLQWMFQNRVAIYVLNLMNKCQFIISHQVNQQYWERNQKIKISEYTYRMNKHIQEDLGTEKLLLQEITRDSNKYVSQQSIFDYYFQQSLQRLQDFIQKQSIYQKYDESVITGLYRPAPSTLQQWLNWQFNYAIDENCNDKVIKYIRNNMNKLFKKYIQRINELISNQPSQKLLGKKFVKVCNKSKEQIQNILIPILSLQITQKKSKIRIQNYIKIIKQIIKYLKNNKIFHIAFYNKNQQQPLTCLLQGNPTLVDQYYNILQTLAGIPQYSITKSQIKFIKFEQKNQPQHFQKKQKLHLQNKNNNNYINQQNQQICQQNIIQDHIQKEKYVDQIIDNSIREQNRNWNVDDAGEQLHIQESIGQNIMEQGDQQPCFIFQGKKPRKSVTQKTQKSSKLIEPQDDICFIFEGRAEKQLRLQQQHQQKQPQLHHPKPKSKKSIPRPSSPKLRSHNQQNKQHDYYEIPPHYRKSENYKILQLQSLDQLSQLLKSIKLQIKLIKKNLSIPYLVLAFQQQQPQQQLLSHLNYVLQSIKHKKQISNSIKQIYFYKYHMIINNLKNNITIKDNIEDNKIKKIQILKQLFNLLDYQFAIIYDQGSHLNKIILCRDTSHYYYLYPILSNQLPMKKYQKYIQYQQIIKTQKLLLKSLLSLPPRQKNTYLDDIRNSIHLINQQIQKSYQQLQKIHDVYKNQVIQNKQQISQKITTYINTKTNNMLKFTQILTVDYTSYKIFIKQFKQLMKIFTGNNLINVFIDNNQQIPICVSKDYQQIKKIFQVSKKQYHHSHDFCIIPEQFQTYVQRVSVDVVIIKYKQIIDVILNDLNQIDKLQLPYILQLLYQTKNRDIRQKIQQQKMALYKNILNQQKITDYKILVKLDKLINNQKNIILSKLTRIQGQFQLLKKIKSIKQQHYSFIQNNINQQIDKQSQFVKQIQLNQRFILEVPSIKTQIPSYNLQQIHKLLHKAGIPHRLIKYHGNTIGIAQTDISIDVALWRRLNMSQFDRIKYTVEKDNQIIIQKLFIEISLSQQINKGQSKQQQLLAKKVLQNYSIQINTQNKIQTLTNLSKQFQHPFEILCDYPRRSIQIKLKQKNQDKKQHNKNIYNIIKSFIIKNYHYGSRYLLIDFQQQILQKIHQQKINKYKSDRLNKIKFGDKDNCYQKINKSQGRFVQQIKFMEINSSSFYQPIDNDQDNQSIVLSQNIQIDRNELIKINKQYKFTDIKNLMKKNQHKQKSNIIN